MYIHMSNVEEELRKEILKLTRQLQEARISAAKARISADKAQLDLLDYQKDSLAQYFSGQRKLPCVHQDGSRTSASISTGHQNVVFKEHAFGMLEISREQINNLEKKVSKILKKGVNSWEPNYSLRS